MKTLNNYDKHKFISKDLVYIGDSPSLTYGGIYRVLNTYNINEDFEEEGKYKLRRLYLISVLNDEKKWESITGDKLVLLSDYRDNQLNKIGI